MWDSLNIAYYDGDALHSLWAAGAFFLSSWGGLGLAAMLMRHEWYCGDDQCDMNLNPVSRVVVLWGGNRI